MHASISTVYFLSCFPSNLSSLSFVFLCVFLCFLFFVFYFLCFSLLFLFIFYLLFIYYCSWLSLIYRLPLWGLPLLYLNCFLFLMGIPLGLPTNLLAVQPLPLLKVCWLHHFPFPDKITCLVPYLSLFLFYPCG